MIDRETQKRLFEFVTSRDGRGDIDICKPPITWSENGADFEAALTKDGETIVITRVTKYPEVTRIVLSRTVLRYLVKQAGGTLPP